MVETSLNPEVTKCVGKTVSSITMGSSQSLHVQFTDGTVLVVNADSYFVPPTNSLPILDVQMGEVVKGN